MLISNNNTPTKTQHLLFIMCPSQVINLLNNSIKQTYYDLTLVMEIHEEIVAKNFLNFMKNINLYIQ